MKHTAIRCSVDYSVMHIRIQVDVDTDASWENIRE